MTGKIAPMDIFQMWLIVGEVLVLDVLFARGFREDMQRSIIREQRLQGYSDRQIYRFATTACAVLVLCWPALLVPRLFR